MKLTVKEMVTLALLGAIMFISKLLTEFLPNVHLLAMLIIAYTVVFRVKAIYAIVVFILLTGAINGFGIWWIPYWYLWPILWGVTLLLPKKMPTPVAIPVYMVTAGLHGILYGTMYAPFQAVAFGLSFDGMVAWIIAGLPWDAVHGVSNFIVASLCVPVIAGLRRAKNAINIS